MNRSEILDAASQKLVEAALLLASAGEDRLAAEAEELAEWVGFSSEPSDGKPRARRTPH